jgi:hypothetical protein
MKKSRSHLLLIIAVHFALAMTAGIIDVETGIAWAKRSQTVRPPMTLSLGEEPGAIEVVQPATKVPKNALNKSATGPKSLGRAPSKGRGKSIRSASVEKQAPVSERVEGAGKKPFEYKDGLLSVEARERPISEVLGQIAGAANLIIVLLDPINSVTISVNMANTPLDEGLRTILKGHNHLVIYNPGKEVPGVWILRQPKTRLADNGKRITPGFPSKERSREIPLVAGARGVQKSTVAVASNQDEQLGRDDQENVTAASLSGEEAAGTETSGSEGETGGRSEPASPKAQAEEGQPSQAGRIEDVQAPAGEGNIVVAMGSPPGSEEDLKRLIYMYEKRIASGVSDREYERAKELSGGGPVMHDRDRIRLWQDALNRNAGK